MRQGTFSTFSKHRVVLAVLAAGFAAGCSGFRREVRVREDLPRRGGGERRIGIAEPLVDLYDYGTGAPVRGVEASNAAARRLRRALAAAVARRGAEPVEGASVDEAIAPLRSALRDLVLAAPPRPGGSLLAAGDLPGVGDVLARADLDLLLVSYAYEGVAHPEWRSKKEKGPPRSMTFVFNRVATTILTVAAVDRTGAPLWAVTAQSPRSDGLQPDRVAAIVDSAAGELMRMDSERASRLVREARHPADRSVFVLMSLGGAAQRVASEDAPLAVSATLMGGARLSILVLGATASLAGSLTSGSETGVYLGGVGGASLPVGDGWRAELLAEAGQHRMEWEVPEATRGLLHAAVTYVGGRIGLSTELPAAPSPLGVWGSGRWVFGIWAVVRRDMRDATATLDTGGGTVTREGGGTRIGLELAAGMAW